MAERRIYQREDGEILECFMERGGLISENDIWVCISSGYMYAAEKFEDLVAMIEGEWKHEKHLIG